MTTPASPDSGRGSTLILFFATSIGIPSAILTFFRTEAAERPGLTVFLSLLWILLVLVGGIVMDVWSEIRKRRVRQWADWVDYHLQVLFSRYRRHYLKWIFYRHRDFDVKGLTTQSTYNLELEQVFVDLTIEPRPPHATSTDPIRPFPKDLTGRRQIWDYLTSKNFKDNLALIGAPGSGKTTLLKKIALQLTGPRRPKIRQNLPLLLFLREHTDEILKDSTISLAELVARDLKRKQSQAQPPAAWFQRKLVVGRCLVLLDGLDEVASLEIRQRVVTWVESQISSLPKNRFLISSRPYGYKTCPISGVTIVEIQPFNRDQVRQFIHNWYYANEIHASGKLDPGVEMKAREGAEDLLKRLGNTQALADLSVNPLLLTMIATVHRFRSSLPGRRVELYAEICEVFLGKRRQAYGIESDLTPAQKQRVLQPLAYHLMETRRREIRTEVAIKVISESLIRVAGKKEGQSEADFLKEVESSSGLLLEREAGLYSFAHLAFQEYLTSVHIRENNLTPGLVTDPWWHEVIRLYGAQGDASQVLAACLSSNNPTVAELSLAIDCLEEAREVDHTWRETVEDLLKEGIESSDPDRFRLAAETILARRLRRMEATNEDSLIDSTYISHAEYQIFLDDMRINGKYYQPDHWKNMRFPEGQALTPAVGMRASDAQAFCSWLSIRDGAFSFRLPYSSEIDEYHLNMANQSNTGGLEGVWTTTGFKRITPPQRELPQIYVENLVQRDFSEEVRLNVNLTLDRSLDRTFFRGIIRILGLDPDRDFDRTRSVARHLALNPNRYSDLILDLDKVLVRNRSRDLVRERARLLVPERDLDLDLKNVLDRSKTSEPSARNLRFRARALSLYLAAISNMAFTSGFRGWLPSRRERTSVNLKESWINIYAGFVILEARVDGILPALEGIILTKERRS